MYKTFEPFRQLQGNIWKEYALISSQYTRLEVVDLEKGEVIAREPYPTITQEYLDKLSDKSKAPGGYAENFYVGEERPGWGFCPVEFYVPDWNDEFSEDSINTIHTPYNKPEEERWLYSDEDLRAFSGHWALYSGCVWGDDSGGWKLRYIDLSHLSEGIVITSEKFGYIELAGSVKDIDIYPSDDTIVIPTVLHASLKTGKSYKLDALWQDDE
jgi:hypothetical protein